MPVFLSQYIRYSDEVSDAQKSGKPILAMESTIITHGLPYPQNIHILHELEDIARSAGVVPATVLVLNGVMHIGLDRRELDELQSKLIEGASLQKISSRELAYALVSKLSGGTTVSTTMLSAAIAKIFVFATGGIGGVHRYWADSGDISMDIKALASYPLIVVSAGCKAILDIPATLEALETSSVPVWGWHTESFPAFYSSKTEHHIPRIDSALNITKAFLLMQDMSRESGLSSGSVLIANPIPTQYEIPSIEIDPVIAKAITEAQCLGIKGKNITPYLLAKISELTAGRSVEANLALVRNNVRLGCEIAISLAHNTN